MKYHFSKLDTSVAKLVAIVLMLLHHLFGFTERIKPENMYQSMYMYNGQPVEAVICSTFKICVAFFVFLSGYGIYCGVRKKSNMSSAIAARIKNLLVCVWQVMLIYVPIDYLLGVKKVNITSSWSIKYDLESWFLSMLGFEKYNGEWWFVMPYIFLLMLTPLLMKWIRRKRGEFFTDFIVVFGLAMFSTYGMSKLYTFKMFESFGTSVWGILLGNVMYLMPIYLMGMIFAKHQVFSYYHQILPKGVLQYPALMIIGFGAFYLRYKAGAPYDFFLVGPMIYACVKLMKDIPGVKWLARKAGRYITLVWLIHTFYIFQFGQRFIYGFRYPVVIFLVLTVVSFASAIAVYWLFEGLKRLTMLVRKQ